MSYEIYSIVVSLFFFSSCDYKEDSENKNDITERMKNYVSNNVDGSYGFFECNMIKEHIDGFSWRADIYRIQQRIYFSASQRRSVIANSYIPLQPLIGKFSLMSISLSRFFDSAFVKPQRYAEEIQKSYITEEEREICDYVYYNASVPEICEIVKDLEKENFHGDRIYYVCGFRIASGAIVYRRYVLYKSDEDESLTICELKYNYDMLRNFTQSTLDVNLEEPKIKALIAKYKAKEVEEKRNSNWSVISTSTVFDRYNMIFRRLKGISY